MAETQLVAPIGPAAQDEAVTFALQDGSWLFRQFDTNDDETAYRFTFLHWVRCGERTDFAAVEIVDAWMDYQQRQVRRAFFAARHAGVELSALEPDDIPAHVHLLATRAEIVDAKEIDSGQFTHAAWVTVEPVGWREAHPLQLERSESPSPVAFQRRPAPGV